MRLKDKVAVVTGGAQGIGRVYARSLALEGSKVVITDIVDTKPAEDEIHKNGGQAYSFRADVSSEADTVEMARKTVDKFGRIDILVNNAAVFATLRLKPFYEISEKEWDWLMAVNVKGLFLCSKAVFPQMKKQGKGKIINISSGTAFKGTPNFLHYVTSKGAVISFTRSLAREVGDYGICVNAIAPGFTLSDTVLKGGEMKEKMDVAVIATRCIKRSQHPEDLVGALIFLCSDESDFITGQTLAVDGGSVMH